MFKALTHISLGKVARQGLETVRFASCVVVVTNRFVTVYLQDRLLSLVGACQT